MSILVDKGRFATIRLTMNKRAAIATQEASIFLPIEASATPQQFLLTNGDTSATKEESIGEIGIQFSLLQGEEIAPGWRILQKLSLILEIDDDGSFIFSDDLFNEYGVGATISEAKRDYINNVINYYLILAERATEENPLTQVQFQHIQQFLAKSDM